MQEHTKQKFAFASESIKQVITLATGVVALTVTFREKVLPAAAATHGWLLVIALVVFLGSVYHGVRALQGVASVLEDANSDDEPSILVPAIAKPAAAQMNWFVAGLGLLIAYFVASVLL